MSASKIDIPPLLPGASRTQSLASADRCIFGHEAPFVLERIAPASPAALADALAGSGLGKDALKFLAVMAFVAGSLDKAKIASVLRYAAALGIEEHYLDEIQEAAQDRLQEVLADMTR